jgi:hypothetical protein
MLQDILMQVLEKEGPNDVLFLQDEMSPLFHVADSKFSD